jgi:hypothetical protein
VRGFRLQAEVHRRPAFRLKPEATHRNVHEPEDDEPEDPAVDEPLDELDVLLLVEDDVAVLSPVDDVSEEPAGLAPSPEDFLA